MSSADVSLFELVFPIAWDGSLSEFTQASKDSFEVQGVAVLRTVRHCFDVVGDVCEHSALGSHPQVIIKKNQLVLAMELPSVRSLSFSIGCSLHPSGLFSDETLAGLFRPRCAENDLLIHLHCNWQGTSVIRFPSDRAVRFDDVCTAKLQEFEKRAIAAIVHQRATTQWTNPERTQP